MKQKTLSQLKKDLTYKVKMPVSANNVTKAIIAYTRLRGGFATRINTQGQYDPRLKIWRPGSTVKGMSDILIVFEGIPIFVEVKVGKDKQSKEQKAFEESVTKAGGLYFVARDIETFKNYLLGMTWA